MKNKIIIVAATAAVALINNNNGCAAFIVGGGTLRAAHSVKFTTRTTAKATSTTARTVTVTVTANAGVIEDLTPSSSSINNSSSSSSKDDNIKQSIRQIHKNWWPVASLSSLDVSKPNAVTLLNKKLVLFRSSSSSDAGDDDSESADSCWTCLDDRCSHRFAPLSEGRLVEVINNEKVDDADADADANGSSSPSSSSSCSTCKMNIQCAYHGWEFEGGTGANAKIPQSPQGNSNSTSATKTNTKKGKGRQDVQSYPIRIKAGMIFVWSDPDSYEKLGKSIPIPVPDNVQSWYEGSGPSCLFQRDLPYGYELLGENLLDLSHLPYSHHGVGGLDRFSQGGPLPFRMIKETEKTRDNVTMSDYYGGDDRDDDDDDESSPNIVVVKPLYEVELDDASNTDPTFLGMKTMMGKEAVPESAELRVAFYQPCHVRYTRSLGLPSASGSQVILYFCPTSSTKSRVFLFNLFGQEQVRPDIAADPAATLPQNSSALRKRVGSFLSRCQSSVQKAIQAKMMKILIAVKFTPLWSHMFSHEIFDGDGIFLTMQGDRMQRGGKRNPGGRRHQMKDDSTSAAAANGSANEPLSYRDYQTPSPADVLVNAFRRYVEEAVKPKKIGDEDDEDTIDESVIDAVQPTSVLYNTDDIPRSKLLDRYESHTKHCPLCLSALEKGRIKEKRLKLLHTVLVGATGASFVTALIGSISGRILASAAAAATTSATGGATASAAAAITACSKMIAAIALGTMAVAGGSAKVVTKLQEKVANNNQKFIFVDYVHADKH